jgi:hypothetical protein
MPHLTLEYSDKFAELDAAVQLCVAMEQIHGPSYAKAFPAPLSECP